MSAQVVDAPDSSSRRRKRSTAAWLENGPSGNSSSAAFASVPFCSRHSCVSHLAKLSVALALSPEAVSALARSRAAAPSSRGGGGDGGDRQAPTSVARKQQAANRVTHAGNSIRAGYRVAAMRWLGYLRAKKRRRTVLAIRHPAGLV